MHPAPSVLIFTTLSGLGFGLLFWLGLGYPPVTGLTAFVFFALAYLLSVGGLVASTFHLGHPERAWRAFSQWRSSWLSREAWAAVMALIVMGLLGAALVFSETTLHGVGAIGAGLCLATVAITSMIYAQLKTVPRWNTALTPLMFLSFSVAGGALLAGQVVLARWLLLLAGLVQVFWWHNGDRAFARSATNLATATGLATDPDQLRAFEPPHTGTNYLLKEMVHVVGRRHAQKLRLIALGFGFVIPVLLLWMPFSHAMAGLAVLCHMSGVLASRWLFFAEAEHVVGLYYGKRQ